MEEPAAETFVDDASLTRQKRNKRLRLAALGFFFVASIVIAKLTGLSEYATIDHIRSFMDSAGVLGFVAFIAFFALGQVLHVPGLIFVGAASIAYGKILAIPAAYVGANVGFVVSFLLIRAIGGQPLGEARAPLFERLRARPIAQRHVVRWFLWAATAIDRLFRRVMARLETHPIQTVAVLRLVFWYAPWITYMLAMSKVKVRHLVIGNLVGIALPIVVAVLFFDWLVGMSSTIGPW